MSRPTGYLALCTVGLIGGLLGSQVAVMAGSRSEDQGAKVYCFMRNSGNAHDVSWKAAYALIKRQGRGLFKTSPEHASVMITEAVVKDPGQYPDCGRYLGDLFGGATTATAASLGSTTKDTNPTTSSSDDAYGITDDARYSY